MHEDPNLDNKRERLLYIMIMTIKPRFLQNLITFEDSELFWNTLKTTFEITSENKKFKLKN